MGGVSDIRAGRSTTYTDTRRLTIRIDEMERTSKCETRLVTHLVCPLVCINELLDSTNTSWERTIDAGPSEWLKVDPSID